MKLHWLQHVPFEGPGTIEAWARQRGARIQCTRWHAGETAPDPADIDLLVIMGGPMGIYDEAEYPWLAQEKAFIRRAIDAGTRILGICLGAQLLADVLGARVYPGPHKEIGWHPLTRAAQAPPLLPDTLTAFHWHGDTFDLPEGAVRLASSEACLNQGFLFGEHIIALQFHLETTPESMEALIDNCAHELVDGPHIQPAEQIRAGAVHMNGIHAAMESVLDSLMRGL